MKKFIAAIAIATICSYANGQALVGEWPQGGGNITVTPTADPIQAGGIELVAEPGILTQGASADPFAFFIPNSAAPGNVTFGSLGTPVTIDGPVELDVAVSASAVNGDISATWGMGVTPTAFPVTTIPEPATGLMAAFGLVGLLGLRRRR